MEGLSEISKIIESIFGKVKNSGRIQQQVNCPKCQERDNLDSPDGKFNLDINLSKHVFRCWKCEDPRFAGSLGYLIKSQGSDFDYQEYKNFITVFGIDIEETDEEKELKKVELPKEIIFFKDMIEYVPEHIEAYNYLINDRQISFNDILKYNMGFCLEGTYKKRIILPSYDENGRMNYFVARTYEKRKKPTYLNPDVENDNIIINEGNINWDSTIYLVEGYFDFFSIQLNTIPCLGKKLPKKLFKKINQYKPNVVIMLDPDAYRDLIKIYEILYHIYGNDYEHKVRIVSIKGEDDIDEIRIKHGNIKVKNILKESRPVGIDDYFRLGSIGHV